MSVSIVGKAAVWRAGYEWVEVNNGDLARIAPIGYPASREENAALYEEYGVKQDERCRFYDPFQEPALFRIFADLDGSPEAILSFCNQFGTLSFFMGRCPEATLAHWRGCIEEMRQAIALWDAVLTGNQRTIARQRESLLERWRWLASGRVADPIAYRDLSAEALLGRVIKDNCRFIPGIQLLPFPSGVMRLCISVEGSMVHALWLQLALSIVERKEYRRCEHCGRPFLLSPEENRSDRRYHNDSCRVKAYRLRKAKAIKMRASGAAIRTIVKELDSDIETVKKWLGEGK